MITEVFMPKAGLTMVEGMIVEWIAKEGTYVKKGDALMEYENEKSTIEFESLADGILHITAQARETVPIGERIGFLAETKEEYNSLLSGDGATVAEIVAEPEEASGEEKGCAKECPTCVHQTEPQTMPAAVTVEESTAVKDGRIRASGLARRKAAEAGINLADVPASNGRIKAKDVEAYLKASRIPFATTAADEDVITETPWGGVKKTIANNMLKSMQSTAQSTCMLEVDATDFLALRKKLVAKEETLGCKISINDMLCKMLGKVMANHPLANATFDGKTLYSHKHVHLSVAVSTNNGLMVPVVRDIDMLNITEIHNKIATLAQQAKDKCLPPDAQSGGTCMMTNFGVFPMDFATPILNVPHTCIVGFGRPKLKPAILPDGTIAARQMMYVVITFDHQVIDGYEAGRIFADIQEYMENPEMILV